MECCLGHYWECHLGVGWGLWLAPGSACHWGQHLDLQRESLLDQQMDLQRESLWDQQMVLHLVTHLEVHWVLQWGHCLAALKDCQKDQSWGCLLVVCWACYWVHYLADDWGQLWAPDWGCCWVCH